MDARALALVLSVLLACGDAAGPPDNSDPDNPLTLAATGLYSDFAAETLAPGVIEYAPTFSLWADGASKRRWVLLPEGEAVDSSDMNYWLLPVGTRLWKEFSRAGDRVETRLLWKQADGWFAMTYLWNAEGTAANAETDGEIDVRASGHDVPRLRDCEACHARQPDYALGFSALLLAGGTGYGLAELVSDGRLSAPPDGAAPYFTIPGAPVAASALGNLHANCGGCHHARADIQAQTPVEFRLDVAALASVETTTTYVKTVDVTHMLSAGDQVTALIEPGVPNASAVYVRMNARGTAIDMPPVASDEVDTEGVAGVAAWISSLPATP